MTAPFWTGFFFMLGGMFALVAVGAVTALGMAIYGARAIR